MPHSIPSEEVLLLNQYLDEPSAIARSTAQAVISLPISDVEGDKNSPASRRWRFWDAILQAGAERQAQHTELVQLIRAVRALGLSGGDGNEKPGKEGQSIIKAWAELQDLAGCWRDKHDGPYSASASVSGFFHPMSHC